MKDKKTLDAEGRGVVRKDLYFLTDDQLKMFALLVAVEDRKKHNLGCPDWQGEQNRSKVDFYIKTTIW